MAKSRVHIRSTIAACALALLVTTLTACGASSSSSPDASAAKRDCEVKPPPEVRDDFPTPDVRQSEDGVLETTMRASYEKVTIDGTQYETMAYDGSVPGPTLVVCPGDTLIVHLENDLGDTPKAWMEGLPTGHDMTHKDGQLTNLHTHGFHVSPRGHSDNVFTSIEPNGDFRYEYRIPDDHPPGMYWYHPHRHGFVDTQVYAGMFGVMYVQGGLDDLPEIRDIPTRTMVVNSFQLGDGEVVPANMANNPLTYVNGSMNPDIEIRPGEIQRWRILNVGPDSIVRLGLQGHDFTVVANDGNTVRRPSPQPELLVAPGERQEVLVRGGPAGDYELQSLPFDQFAGGAAPATAIATMHSRGEADRSPREITDGPLTGPQEDLRDYEVHDRHRLVYSERNLPNGDTEFLINGKMFDPQRLDQVMHLNRVAEWELVNTTDEWHTFHIHVNRFQVTDVKLGNVAGVSSGRVEDVQRGAIERQDTVKMPPQSTVTLRTRPTDFSGKFVFHCHMLFHEDHGMMGTVEVRED